MTEIRGSRTVTVTINSLSPGEGESWVAGSPILRWGDGAEVPSFSGPTLTHTYDNIGEYYVRVNGLNDCNTAYGTGQFLIVIEAPTNISVSDITPTGATLTWTGVPGCTNYNWDVFDGGTVVIRDNANTTSVTLTELTPGTYYDVWISATIDTSEGIISSEYHCPPAYVDFTTLSDVCNPPKCSFTIDL